MPVIYKCDICGEEQEARIDSFGPERPKGWNIRNGFLVCNRSDCLRTYHMQAEAAKQKAVKRRCAARCGGKG